MLIKCESQENACSDKMCLLFPPFIWKTLIRKDEILKTIRKKGCILCRKDSMRKDLDMSTMVPGRGSGS